MKLTPLCWLVVSSTSIISVSNTLRHETVFHTELYRSSDNIICMDGVARMPSAFSASERAEREHQIELLNNMLREHAKQMIETGSPLTVME